MDYINRISQGSQLMEQLSVDNIRNNYSKFQTRLVYLRSPQEFFNLTRISKPQNFGEVQARLSYNLRYFSTNYTLIILVLFAYTLLTNLLLTFVIFIVIIGLVGISRLQGNDLVTPFFKLTTSQLYVILFCTVMPMGVLASPISTLVSLIGLSAAIVFSHASIMEKPIQTVFEDEQV